MVTLDDILQTWISIKYTSSEHVKVLYLKRSYGILLTSEMQELVEYHKTVHEKDSQVAIYVPSGLSTTAKSIADTNHVIVLETLKELKNYKKEIE